MGNGRTDEQRLAELEQKNRDSVSALFAEVQVLRGVVVALIETHPDPAHAALSIQQRGREFVSQLRDDVRRTRADQGLYLKAARRQ